MVEKTQKKGLFKKVEWVKPYYKELQNKLINRALILIAVLFVAAVALVYMDMEDWAMKCFYGIILCAGVIIGNVMAIQMINKNDAGEPSGKKKAK